MKEFNLSDKIGGYSAGDILSVEDVKEFIKRLKHQLHLWEIDEEEIDKLFDKLAGDKLI